MTNEHRCPEEMGDLFVCIQGVIYGPCDWCDSPCQYEGVCDCDCHRKVA